MKNVYYTSDAETYEVASFEYMKDAMDYITEKLNGMPPVSEGENAQERVITFCYEIYDGEPIQNEDWVEPIYESAKYYAI